VKRACS